MPTKRVKRTPAPIGITAEAAEAWRIGDFCTLNRVLGFMPFEASPFNAHREHPGAGEFVRASLPRARAVRAALIEIAGPPGRFDRHGGPLGPAESRSRTSKVGAP
ncbi:MAG: hypothetical protein K0S35_1497 [Geminicoccaceae bacterium]|nr:hypothetical protein [Geminicoccaceae bacterium]